MPAAVAGGLVSFALNDKPGVAPDTRRRILDATIACAKPNQLVCPDEVA